MPSILETIRALLVAHGGASLLSKLCSELYSVPGGSQYKEQIGAAGGPKAFFGRQTHFPTALHISGGR